MDYREMPGGREMDRLIAEKVFERDPMNARRGLHEDPKEIEYYWGYPAGHDIAAYYSTSIGYAWQVVDRMREEGYWLMLKSPFFEGQPWWAGFTPHKTTGWNSEPDNNQPGETAAIAICRSALMTAGRSER